MKNKRLCSLPLPIFVLLALGAVPAGAGEIQGRVVAPRGSGPSVVFLRGVPATSTPQKDTVITHLAGGRFEPAVAIGYVGNEFVFRNEDDTLHTTHLYLHLAYQEERSGRPIRNGATLYNIALPKPGMEVRRPIKSYHEFSDDTGFIAIRCNPHPEEEAVALVFDHPYAAVAEEGGSFAIENVPAGTHELWVWHDGEVSKWGSVDVEKSGPTEIVVKVGAP